MRLYIGNLSPTATEADLQQIFTPFGTVTSATVIMDRASGASRGFGFVEMAAAAEAEAAMAGLNATDLLGQPLVVSEARPRRDDTRTARERGEAPRS